MASKEQIAELRRLFDEKFKTEQDRFHPADLERFWNNDNWVGRFVEHVDGNMESALNMLTETLDWRKSYGTNEINETNIRMDYLIDGCVFTHSKDKDGCRLFIFKCKKHVKGQKDFDEFKRCVVYWFERMERMDKCTKQISLFFDMSDCGVSNMDMDFTRYLIGLFKQCYPNYLNYILIFEMPWILNAAFKIIKSWLPEKAVEKIKFVNKKTLGEYVAPENALKCWGGIDEYVYTFVPEDIEVRTPFRDVGAGEGSNGNKKVTFVEGSAIDGIGEGKYENNPDAMLGLNPHDIIVFSKDGSDLQGSFTIKNLGNRNVSYKVKTTSPEKFRVRPSNGSLNEGEYVTINVILLPGFQIGGLSRDKFLIMGMPIEKPNMTSSEINDLWKNNSGKQVEQHRLRCTEQSNSIISRNGFATINQTEVSTNQINSLISSVKKIQDHQMHLQRSVRRTEILQLLNLVLFISLSGIFLYMLKNEINLTDSPQACYRE